MSLPDDAASSDSSSKGGSATSDTDKGVAPKTTDSKDKDAKTDTADKGTTSAAPAADASVNPTTVAQPASCKDLRTAYRASRFSYLKFFFATKGMLARLDDFADLDPNPAPVSDAALKPILASLQQYQKDSPAAIALAHVANQTYDVIEAECQTPIKVELKHIVDADPDHIFQLTLNTDDFASDQLTVKTDEAGLPVLVETAADDQTGTFLTSLATSVGTIVGLVKPIPLPIGDAASIVVTGSKTRPVKAVGRPPTLDELIAALSKAPPQQRPHLLAYIMNMINSALPPTPESIDPAIPSAAQTYLISDLEKGPLRIADGIALQAACGLRLSASPIPVKTADGKIVPNHYPGVVASLPRPCTVRVSLVKRFDPPKSEGDFADLDPSELPPLLKMGGQNFALGPDLARASFLALDSKALFVVPIERSTLVKRTAHIEFAAGRVVNTQYTRPSPAVAAASLPANVVGGFLSGIVGGITGRTNSVKAETDLVNAKAAMLAAQAAYKKAAADPQPASTSK